MKFRVYLQNTISTAVVVEADNEDDAIDEAIMNNPGEVMFLNHTYPDMGEWEESEVEVVEE